MIDHTETAVSDRLSSEVARRRTFAIISHPDAGKTTLTEKFLLYAGAVDLAGAVRGRKTQRPVTSDWMELERQRGISITTTALQFDYQGFRLNLLDTPGHQDFSEDTYRTLIAVDAAVMVLDGAKGIEPQTLKLFEVCRARRIPILTFINKMDRPALEPLSILDQIETTLSIGAAPMNWPLGEGQFFHGVYDLRTNEVLQFERTDHGQRRVPVRTSSIEDASLDRIVGEKAAGRFREDVALVQSAGSRFDRDRFLAGDVTPVFFGSALNNFGVETFLAAVLELAPPPRPYISNRGAIQPNDETFSGFVFKIQGNMDPKHRDSVAFLRVCSGRFQKDMQVYHARLGKRIRISRPHRLFGRERETLDEAYPGDVMGLVNPGVFAIGDTVSSIDGLAFAPIPRFTPERYAFIRAREADKYKRFSKGLQQLQDEGVIQVLYPIRGGREPILAAVGELQFEVAQARLEGEYGVSTELERLPHTRALLVAKANGLAEIAWPRSTILTSDPDGETIALFLSDWEVRYFQERHPEVEISGRSPPN
jgi:peptide chain release factor 3